MSSPTESDNRRSNLALRTLIDEMLEKVRHLSRNSSAWNEAERSRAEAELDGVMARVRRVAAQKHTYPE